MIPTAVKLPKAELPSSALAIGAFLVPCLLCIPRTGVGPTVVLLLAGVAALWIGQHQAIAERWLRQHPRSRWSLILGCSLLLSVITIGDLVDSKWWVIDDHQLADMLGSDQRLGFGEMIQSLREHPEVGQLGGYPRARPVYFVIRHIEVFLWGNDLELWYGSRVLALAGVFALCWHLLWRWLGGIDAGLMLLTIFCWRMWADIWSRIGSSETYAMVAIAISMLGVVLSERFAKESTWKNAAGWLLIALGAMVSMGCKENFLIMAPATVGYAGWLWYRQRLTTSAIVGTLAVIAAAAGMSYAVLYTLSNFDGADVYNNKRSVGTLLWSTLHCMTAHLGAIMLLVMIGLIVFAKKIRGNERLARLLPQTKTTIWLTVALLALFVSQYAFYNDFDTFTRRYAFPAALAPLLMLPLLGRLCWRYRRIIGGDRQRIRQSVFAVRLAMVLLVGGMGLTMQRHAIRHVDQTRDFTNELVRIAELCSETPDKPLVFVSHRPYDYESLYSVAKFLRYYEVSNPMFLRIEGYGLEDYTDDLNQMLVGNLEQASANGDLCFLPLSEMPTDDEPLGIGFTERPDDVVCVAEFPCWR